MSSTIMAAILPPANSSLLRTLTPTEPHYPFYHPTGASILPFMTDKVTSLLVPIVAYWVFSLIWHAIDCAELPFFEKYRIHESEEVLARNRATVGEVIKAVVIQQVVQTALGMVWLESEEEILKREVWRDHTSDMKGLAGVLGSGLQVLLGDKTALAAARLLGGEKITGWVYWWGVPLLQMGFAFFIIDTWQYFLHRLFHTVPFLYRHFHSVHHRLYVPYAFGALYNHPIEGLLLDSLGAVLAHSAAGMTVRQSIVLFGISTIKTVDDHCGYNIWWDPFQAVFGNNTEYHDLHHQSWGIKKNFSQPFFTKWDEILGTRMSAEQAAKMYARRAAAKAEALAHALEEKVEESVVQVEEKVIKPVLEVGHDVVAAIKGDNVEQHDQESEEESGRGTPVEEIDSGVELEEIKSRDRESVVGKTTGVQITPNGQGVQTRSRARRT